jgi:hypothetical protein
MLPINKARAHTRLIFALLYCSDNDDSAPDYLMLEDPSYTGDSEDGADFSQEVSEPVSANEHVDMDAKSNLAELAMPVPTASRSTTAPPQHCSSLQQPITALLTPHCMQWLISVMFQSRDGIDGCNETTRCQVQGVGGGEEEQSEGIN